MNRKIGVILSYVLMIFEVLSTLLLTPFILRTLGQAEYGIYRLSGTIVSYLLLLDLGVGNASIRFFAKYRVNNNLEQGKRFFGVSLLYYSAIALIALIIGVICVIVYPTIFAKGLTQAEIIHGQKLLGITMLSACVTLATSPFTSSVIAYEKFAISKGSSIITAVFKIVFTYIALKLGFGSLGIVLVHLGLTIINRAFIALYVLFKIRLLPILKGVNFAFLKEIIGYSTFILLQMVATQINAGVGQVLIGALVSSSAAIIGIYSIGTQVVQYFQSIGSAVTSVLMPGVVKLVESKAEPKRMCDEMVRIGRLILMVLILIWTGFILFGKQFISLWAGAENIEAYGVALMLMTVYMFILTEAVGSQVLWAMNAHKEQAIIKISVVAVNVIITWMLLKINAIYGVTIGTFISLMLGDIVLSNIVFKKKIKISLTQYYRDLFKGILPCALITLAVGMLLNMLNLKGWLGLGCNILGIVIVFLLSMLKFGMNNYEKNLVLGMVKKVFRRK